MKKTTLEIITPNRYVYHLSDIGNRLSINNNGLLPMSFKKSKWKDSSCLKYPNAVFANNSNYFPHFFPIDEWIYRPQYYPDLDVWRIDTHKFKATWFKDNRFIDSVFTIKKIPRRAIKLYCINHSYITDNSGCLLPSLMLSEYIYSVNPITGKPSRLPKNPNWPLLPDEIIEANKMHEENNFQNKLENIILAKNSKNSRKTKCALINLARITIDEE
jgi:hypothetical protein